MRTDTAADLVPDQLVERLFAGALGMIDLQMTYIGDRLGLYRALARGDASAGELGRATGCDARYVREWLEQQAVAGILTVDDAGAASADRRYRLPAPYAEVLTDRDSVNHLAPFARMLIGVARRLPAVLDAFRTGGGVPYADYDLDFCEGQADMNRTMFINQLASEWLPALPDVHERLLGDPPARVADVACGAGHSTLALARAYPRLRVEGFDLDAVSVGLARRSLAAEADLVDRVTFAVRDAADPPRRGAYDLVTIFEAIHDMPRPVEALRGVRYSLAAGGCVLVADERVAETFTAPGNAVEQLMYGYSVLHCLPVGMAERPSAMTGTAMRPDTLRRYAGEAGFRDVEVLPIEHDFWRFYRLDP
jgi:2-polyprenyl-3-methyl-5-hydroxy-6-metoxy-1,4-benzoquinol methylase